MNRDLKRVFFWHQELRNVKSLKLDILLTRGIRSYLWKMCIDSVGLTSAYRRTAHMSDKAKTDAYIRPVCEFTFDRANVQMKRAVEIVLLNLSNMHEASGDGDGFSFHRDPATGCAYKTVHFTIPRTLDSNSRLALGNCGNTAGVSLTSQTTHIHRRRGLWASRVDKFRSARPNGECHMAL